MKTKKNGPKVTVIAEKKNAKLDEEKMKQLLVEEARKRVVDCEKEIQEAIQPILDKFKCDLDISMILRAGNIKTQLGCVPRR